MQGNERGYEAATPGVYKVGRTPDDTGVRSMGAVPSQPRTYRLNQAIVRSIASREASAL